jgi:hypothetical protein
MESMIVFLPCRQRHTGCVEYTTKQLNQAQPHMKADPRFSEVEREGA